MIVRNNRVTIIVRDSRKDKDWFYVFHDLCASTQWSKEYVKHLIKLGNNKRTQNFSKSLSIAHSGLECEYGVHIIRLFPSKQKQYHMGSKGFESLDDRQKNYISKHHRVPYVFDAFNNLDDCCHETE